MPRFTLLEHTGAPDDPAGRHFDLLLEGDADCRTWRLAAIPVAGGPAVAAEEIHRHRLVWLDHESGPITGGRGFARRVDAGTFRFVAGAAGPNGGAETAEIMVAGGMLTGRLLLEAGGRCLLT